VDLMQRFAWVFGAVGGLAIVATIIMRLAVGVSGGAWSAVGGVGVVLLLLFLWLDRDSVSATAASRSARYTSGAVVLVFVTLGVMVALNVVSTRFDKRWDLTSGGMHTLAPQSTQVAQGLTSPVTILGFYNLDSYEGSDFDILTFGYDQASEMLSVERIDPNRDLLTAQRYEVDRLGTVVLVMGDRTERIEDIALDEESLTNALIRLTTQSTKTVCFTSGHDERRIDDEDVMGLSGIGSKLEKQGTVTVGLVLVRSAEVPESCDAVVIAAPQTELLPQELETLAAYLRGGGSMMVLLDPVHSPLLANDLARYGVAVGDDVVVENNPSYQMVGTDPTYIILDRSSFSPHPMVSDGDALVLMRAVRSVTPIELDGLSARTIATTSEASWAETDYLSGNAPQPDPGEKIGSVSIITAVEVLDPAAISVGIRSLPAGEPLLGVQTPEIIEPGDSEIIEAPDSPEEPLEIPAVEASADPGQPGGRLLVFGDSDFVANGLVMNGTNQDLFLNALAWLLGEEDTVSIRANEAGRGTLEMTEVQSALVWLLSILVIPGLAVMGGVGTWLRRRNL
jgi:ABC-type uncharacterized transport system involved in gliding motility auxiliary subunit